ncbi:MAG: hypothetical protein AB1696_24535 [Planctomycetota bacterium]
MPDQAQWPYSLAKARECLEGFQPPVGDFDPQGAWDHRYSVWKIVPNDRWQKTERAGVFRIRRRPEGDQTVVLHVTLCTEQGRGPAPFLHPDMPSRPEGKWKNLLTLYHVDATVTCAADRLATPKSWELRAAILTPTGQPVAGTEVRETGQVGDVIVRRRGKAERSIPAPKSLSCNWSIFDALQRLPADAAPLEFDMLEEMDLLKPGQRLTYRESVEIELKSGRLRLHGYDQLGEGILPYNYWLDDRRRLLLAIGGMRAFVFDPSAHVPEVMR